MITKQTFFDRLKYGKHSFAENKPVYGKPHTNPDGTRGGWVAETALVEDTCYIDPEASVYEYAHVMDKARILGSSSVYGFATVGENVIITDWAEVTDSSVILGHTYVGNGVMVCGDSYLDFGHLDDSNIYKNHKQILKAA